MEQGDDGEARLQPLPVDAFLEILAKLPAQVIQHLRSAIVLLALSAGRAAKDRYWRAHHLSLSQIPQVVISKVACRTAPDRTPQTEGERHHMRMSTCCGWLLYHGGALLRY